MATRSIPKSALDLINEIHPHESIWNDEPPPVVMMETEEDEEEKKGNDGDFIFGAKVDHRYDFGPFAIGQQYLLEMVEAKQRIGTNVVERKPVPVLHIVANTKKKANRHEAWLSLDAVQRLFGKGTTFDDAIKYVKHMNSGKATLLVPYDVIVTHTVTGRDRVTTPQPNGSLRIQFVYRPDVIARTYSTPPPPPFATTSFEMAPWVDLSLRENRYRVSSPGGRRCRFIEISTIVHLGKCSSRGSGRSCTELPYACVQRIQLDTNGWPCKITARTCDSTGDTKVHTPKTHGFEWDNLKSQWCHSKCIPQCGFYFELRHPADPLPYFLVK